jgi:hypothetical protein
VSPEERKCLEGVVYPLMYIFVFLLSLPVLVKFMDTSWAKWLYCGLAFGGLVLIVRLRLLLNRVR